LGASSFPILVKIWFLFPDLVLIPHFESEALRNHKHRQRVLRSAIRAFIGI
jgi:hypothetical protein